MSMMVSFVLSFFPGDVLDEILNLIESVSEDFPSYSHKYTFYTLYHINPIRCPRGTVFHKVVVYLEANVEVNQPLLNTNSTSDKQY